MFVCVFWSYVIVNHFNFSIIFYGPRVIAIKQPYAYLGMEPYIVCVFKLICSVYIFARFA